MKIVILAGGISTERSVSIVSGTKVAEALKERGHQIALIDVCGGVDQKHADDAFLDHYDVAEAAEYMHSFDDQIREMENRRSFFGPGVLALCEEADCVFLALHGANGEDGRLQAAFDLLGIPYTGSNYLGSALAMDKELGKMMFRANGVPTPAGIVVRRSDKVIRKAADNGVGLPCVVKPACGGSSVGVSIPQTEEEYAQALQEGFRYEDVLLVEQYVRGREFSVGVIDDVVYPVIEIAPIEGFYDYTNKYKAGSTVETCPADLTEEQTKQMQQHALDAYHALRLSSYGRIDVMMDQDGSMYCLEGNTLPGMTPTSLLPQEAAAEGIDFASLCEKLIEVSIRGK